LTAAGHVHVSGSI